MTLKEKIIDAIKKEKKSIFHNNNKIFGIRGDNYNYEISDEIKDSNSIYDNEVCENLNSTCAIFINENSDFESVINIAKSYGNNIYLIYGDNWGQGEDTHNNEIKIKNAEILLKL